MTQKIFLPTLFINRIPASVRHYVPTIIWEKTKNGISEVWVHLPPGGRYFFVAGAQYNHNFYQGLYENKPLSFKKGTWTFFTYQTFKIDKRSVITLNGFVRLKGQQQFYELTTFGALNASVNRKFMKDKLVATISISDMFATNRNNFTIEQGSVNASGFRQADTRRLGT